MRDEDLLAGPLFLRCIHCVAHRLIFAIRFGFAARFARMNRDKTRSIFLNWYTHDSEIGLLLISKGVDCHSIFSKFDANEIKKMIVTGIRIMRLLRHIFKSVVICLINTW